MTEYVMIPLTPAEADGRPVIDTGVSLVGKAGNDFVCAHCGRVMITAFDIAAMRPDMVYRCGTCRGFNGAPKIK